MSSEVNETAPVIAEGRFRLGRRLGEGGQAIVYAATDTRLNVERALKVLLPRFAQKKKVRARFESEAQTMARFDHRNIVRIFDVSTDLALPFLVMELVQGGSLARRVERHGALAPHQAVEVLDQVAAGLALAHSAGIVHRDVKPHNILLSLDGTCKLTDFGIARTESGHRTKFGASMGTEGYMAPEQGSDASAVDPRADVYSMGVLAFVLLTGRDPVEWLSGRGAALVPTEVRDALIRATRETTSARFPTIEAMADALKTAVANLPADRDVRPLVITSPDTGESEPEDYSEISTLVSSVTTGVGTQIGTHAATFQDDAKTSPTSETPRQYQMSRPQAQAADARTPDWIDRQSLTTDGGSFSVELDDEEKRRSDETRRKRAEAPPPEAVEAPPTVDLAQLDGVAKEAGAVQRLLFNIVEHPLRAILPAVLLFTLFGGVVAGIRVWSDRNQQTVAAQIKVVRTGLHRRLDEQRMLLDEIALLGGDRVAIEDLYVQWHEAREPDKTQIALLLITEIEREVATLETDDTTTGEALRKRVMDLAASRDAFREVTQP